MSSAGGTEELPEFYHFPPFFTLQPVLETRKMQMKLWHDFILRWHQVSLGDTMNTPPICDCGWTFLRHKYKSQQILHLLDAPDL